MSTGEPINLIRVFDFYVMLMFVISLIRRWRVYVDAIRILFAVRWRWPRLIDRLTQHRSLILNWSFYRPVILALILALVQLMCSRLIFPLAHLTLERVQSKWWCIAAIGIALVPMLAVDLYFVIRVGKFDHDETVKYFDQAETWLGYRGSLVRFFTLGIVNPRKMVDEEVKKNLTEYQSTLKASLWWATAQIGLRLLFGITLWLVWAIQP